MTEKIEPRTVRVGTPAALLSTVPHLLGFMPDNSLVVIGTEPPRNRIKLSMRYDLPSPSDPAVAAGVAAHVADLLAEQKITTAVLVGYGPAQLVTPVVDALRAVSLPQVRDILRVADGRYWSYTCTDASCCPPEGTPFDQVASADLKDLPVLADRAALAISVAPVNGETAESMRHATQQAETRADELARQGDSKQARRHAIATAGRAAVVKAIDTYRTGGRLTSPQRAWLTVLLQDLQIRDEAWARMDPEHRDVHLRLWRDLTRHAQPGYVDAPASLLAFTAWQSGNGALANVALDRALDDDPDYSMALLLREVIDAGAPPSMARLPMSPDEVTASYEGEPQ